MMLLYYVFYCKLDLCVPHASVQHQESSAYTYGSGLTGCSIWGSCIALMLASAAPEQVHHAHIAPAFLVVAFGTAVDPQC